MRFTKNLAAIMDQTGRRSEEIRQRRKRHAADKKKAALKSITPRAKLLPDRRKATGAVPAPPPVMTRSPYIKTAQTRSKRSVYGQTKNARRRYDLALNAQGAEMRLPSIPRVRVGWRWVSLCLAAFLAVILYQLWTSPMYQVDVAEVEGLQRLTSGDVNSALSLTGQPVFALDAAQIQQELLDEFPEFSAVSAQVALPSTVMITVTERLPVLVWLQDGRSNLVDEEGVTFPLRDGSAQGQYVVVEASGSPPAITTQDLAPSSSITDISDTLLAQLPVGVPVPSEAKPLLSPEMVSAVLLIAQKAPQESVLIYDPVHGLGWKDRRGWQVYLGDTRDMETKLLIYRAILEQVKSPGERPTLISVEFVHAPYYRMEPIEEAEPQ